MPKKIALRMCIVCRQMKQKNDLQRVVKNNSGEVFVDLTYKAGGRGAYVCKTLECIEKCQKKKALNRSFKSDVKNEVYEELKSNLKNF